VRQIAIDRWNATQLSLQLQGDGIEVVGFGQGFGSMSSPSKQLEGAVVAGRLRHGGNPVLSWMASNASVKVDAAGNIKPVKPPHGSAERIDGIVALVMAIGCYAAQKPTDGAEPSILFL
jgi:phage terminase large subunit-like protein